MSGAHTAALRPPFDEAVYRASLETLGLAPPVDRDAIHRAYRENAKRIHPDRFQDEEEKARATLRIQEINAAHAYALQHWRGFQLARRWSVAKVAAHAVEPASWHEWLCLPVTTVYALTTIAAAAPVVGLARLAGLDRLARWRESRTGAFLWRLWILVAPHGATLALFAMVDELLVKAWFGVSFLIMVSADIATLVTGDSNALRRPLAAALPPAWSGVPAASAAQRERRRSWRSRSSSARSGAQ